MIKKILLGLVALIVIVLIAAAMQPASFRVERSITIAATPEAVFEQVNDHKKFNGLESLGEDGPDLEDDLQRR
jgi:hypothetical protein